jgi:hypothetical protein
MNESFSIPRADLGTVGLANEIRVAIDAEPAIQLVSRPYKEGLNSIPCL